MANVKANLLDTANERSELFYEVLTVAAFTVNP